MQHAQIAIFKFAIYLEKPETQLFYYAIKTRHTVVIKDGGVLKRSVCCKRSPLMYLVLREVTVN